MVDLTPLEIRILLKCSANPLGKKDVSQLYRAHSLADREQAIQNLIENGLVLSKRLPKPNSKKIPIYYLITDSGKKWISNYIKNFPTTDQEVQLK